MARFLKGQQQARKVRCKVCGKVFDSVQKLGGHMGAHTTGESRATASATAQSTPPQPPTGTQAPQTEGFVWPSWEDVRGQVQAAQAQVPGKPPLAPGQLPAIPLKIGLGRFVVNVINRIFKDDPLTPDESAAIVQAFDDLIGVRADRAPPYIILPFDPSPIIAVALVIAPRWIDRAERARKKPGQTGVGGGTVLPSSQLAAGAAAPPGPKGA